MENKIPKWSMISDHMQRPKQNFPFAVSWTGVRKSFDLINARTWNSFNRIQWRDPFNLQFKKEIINLDKIRLEFYSTRALSLTLWVLRNCVFGRNNVHLHTKKTIIFSTIMDAVDDKVVHELRFLRELLC